MFFYKLINILNIILIKKIFIKKKNYNFFKFWKMTNFLENNYIGIINIVCKTEETFNSLNDISLNMHCTFRSSISISLVLFLNNFYLQL